MCIPSCRDTMKCKEETNIQQIFFVLTIFFCTGTCDLGLRFYARSVDSRENVENKEISEEKQEMAPTITEDENTESPHKEDIVLKFLRTVEEIERNTDNCTAGTNVSLGEGVVDQYGVRRFRGQAVVAVNRANFLTRIWKNAEREVLDSEYLLYTLVRSMVEIDDDIFGAGNCYDAWGYKDYDLFCAFAYRLPNGEILAKDLSVQYKYLGNDSEWFWEARQRAKKAIERYNSTKVGFNMYRYNETMYGPKIKDEVLTVGYEDGHWSKPYFDCGGGNIWMMTYTVPFFGYDQENKTYHFKGTSGIDIDLRNVDIDQCPPVPGSTELNVFAGSDKCRRTTTRCEPLPGLGFRRGSYKCVCQTGYYFPIPNAVHRYFNGTIIEDEYEKKLGGLENTYEYGFECLPCAEGCDECQDASPCILSLGWAQRTAILVIACIIIGFLPVVVWFTFKFAEVKVLKAASPVLLRIILLGAFLLYGPIIVLYPEPSAITCTLRVWLRETGFAVSYGALLLKTWRISVVFRVRSAQRVKITDNSLIKRLAILVSLICGFLTVRTVVAQPKVVIGKSSEGLKAYLCSTDWWDHSSAIGELCFLLWGIRLCFVVRKAPSEFNESKFISWAIYNEFLLSMFLNISMLFLQSPANPDLLYIIFFVHSQLTTTVVVFLLFGSKAYMVYKGLGKGESGGGDSADRTSSKYISKPKSQVTRMSHMPLTSSTSTQDKTSDVSDQEGSTLEQDVQEEFKRLYMQLELLKSKNMKAGNPHLTYKLSAMTEAANMSDPSEINTPTTNSNTKRKVVINLDEANEDVEV